MERPRNVALFEVLIYLGLVLDMGAVMRWNRASFEGWEFIEAASFYLLLFALLVFAVWAAARRGRNWARFVLLALILTSVPDYFHIFADLANFDYSLVALRILSDSLQLAALYFVFSPEARPWFNVSAFVPDADARAVAEEGSTSNNG